MAAFKEQTFQERGALAAKAKQAALDKLKARAPVDEAVLAERRAAAAEAAKPYVPKMLSAAEMKAARDARYAARKARSGR